MINHVSLRQIISVFTALLVVTTAQAEGETPAAKLVVELNSVTILEGACRLTFMAKNNTTLDISSLAFETVLFTTEGEVERLTLFDLGTLPIGRPRVRQFDIPGLTCDALGQVLINGIAACEGEGHSPASCMDNLLLKSRIDVELFG